MMSPRALTAGIDRTIDAGVMVFAAWTIAYHVCFVLELSVTWAWGITAVVVLGGWLILRWLSDDAPTVVPARAEPVGSRQFSPQREWLAYVAVVAAAVGTAAMAFRAPWILFWSTWLLAAVAGTVTAWRGLRHPQPRHAVDDDAPIERWSPAIALGWATLVAVLSLWTVGPNGDDLYYLNLSQWVAEHGAFPHRDTLFADLVYPMSNWPPAASYDALVGAVARLVSAESATVAYVVVVPVASFVAVLALWRLLRAWQARPAVLALSVVVLSFVEPILPPNVTSGLGLVVRIWQGKFLLAWIVIPWLVAHLVRYFDERSRRQLLFLFAGGVAAVGCSTTGIFVVPVIALAASVPLFRTSWRGACACFAATAAYPLGTGIVTKLVGGRDADLFATRLLYRFDPAFIGRSMFHAGPRALFLCPAVLLGCLLIPHRGARVMTGVLACVLGVVFVPGVTHVSFDLVGLGPSLGRIQSALVFVALVGVAFVWVGSLARQRWWRGPALTLSVAVLLFAFVGSPATLRAVTWQRPFHWQRAEADRIATARILRDIPLDGLLLAPNGVSITTTITTTSVKAVAPRDYYMDYLRDDPTFHYDDRLTLVQFVNSHKSWNRSRWQPVLDHAFSKVNVAVACVFADAKDRAAGLRAAGFKHYFTSPTYRCFRRPPAASTSAPD